MIKYIIKIMGYTPTGEHYISKDGVSFTPSIKDAIQFDTESEARYFTLEHEYDYLEVIETSILPTKKKLSFDTK